MDGIVKAKEKIENQHDKPTVPLKVIPGGKGSLKSRVRNEESTLCTVHDGIAMDVVLASSGSEEDEDVNEAAERLRTRYAYRFIKRFFDIAFSLFVIIGFSWLFLIIAVAVKIDDPKGPIIFKQKRVTRNGREFSMYKFRSMCADAEDRLSDLAEFNEKTGPVFKMHDDPRITRVGRVTRRLSLDELPQFINVLRSDMSIVGPRPALPAEVATYDDYQRQRLLVKSGLTCYWQTRRNRDSITFDEWVDLDLLYIKKCSAWSDLKLIVQTVGVVLTAQGN